MIGNNRAKFGFMLIILFAVGLFTAFRVNRYYIRNCWENKDSIQQYILLDTLRAETFYKGDTLAYRKLKEEFHKLGIPQNIYIYAWAMANKYNYFEGYKDMATCIKNVFEDNPSLQPIDTISQNMINEYNNEYKIRQNSSLNCNPNSK